MEYVRQYTSYHLHLSWFHMDYIEGEMLMECWDKQSWFLQFRTACTLRLYIQQLHSLKRGTMGTVDTVRQFKRFCDMVALERWKIIAIRHEMDGLAWPAMPTLPTDWTPMFIHGDLNASNVMLDKQGCLWVLDWHTAGFYPPCLEALSMQFVDDELNADYTPHSWP
ncbi:hypothetical protein GY45DRAFT_1375033 [Cubamyces sp. BRFM 1775]|nr:hypothetical protein GY45DRAFT_1375033 [Cubamyces sp. BRFM 1775]